MVDAKLNQELANKISNILPKTITKKLDWLDLDKDTKLSFDKNTTQWKAFNDVTEMLTHEGKSFGRIMYNMQRLDNAFGTSNL